MNRSGKSIEILAPVGGQEQLVAAVRSGADAVYFGLQDFNARRNAENFAGEGLKDTVAYCHLHGVKVYITINTLVKDEELTAVKRAVDTAGSAAVDALIVQDLAVAAYARQAWPGLPLFASTQMACVNEAGARQLAEMGFSRVVLARELSLAEIRRVISRTGAEAEVFVHGAHCMSVSGACYLSSVIGARSGNRGLCAQPCRLDWHLGGKDYALSLKDLSYVERLKELEAAGVASVKIEGRMKRAEYVAASVTACRDALDGRKPDMETLRAVFSRSGFTDGHLSGKRGPDMFGIRTKEDVTAASDVLPRLAKIYEKEPQSVAVDMYLSAHEGEPSVLTVIESETGRAVTAEGPVPERARSLPLSEEYAARSLSKTGGSMYYMDSLSLDAGEGLMLPASALNAMRRDALAQLDAARIEENTPEYAKRGKVEGAAVAGSATQIASAP
ncbi:MAG: U32 family peptidase, partial [Firmicutes bacterium]|nr:U32 family peptidase [Bacillota bacterium]